MANYTWTTFYMELANQLLSYKGNHPALIHKLEKIYKRIGKEFPVTEKDGQIIRDIDPFTVFSLFNKKNSKNTKIMILQEIQKEFHVQQEVPTGFDGVPEVNNFSSYFFPFQEEREENHIADLWTIFTLAISYADHPSSERREKLEKQFDKVMALKEVCWNITMGFYWIRPYKYISLDQNTRNYFQKINKVPSGHQYLKLCEDMIATFSKKGSEYKNFPELSYAIYSSKKKKSKDETFFSVESLDWKQVLEENKKEKGRNHISKNTILYGPPGTGKTYRTTLYAVAIIENKEVEEIEREEYAEVLKRYRLYKEHGLIEFTTFHQSYGYEEFIEGIRPEVDDEGNLFYKKESGIFKSFCEWCLLAEEDYGWRESPNIWKVSLGGTGENPIRSDCMQNHHIRISYDQYGANPDMNEVKEGYNVLRAFLEKMKIGDIVLSCYSESEIDAIGIVLGEATWDEQYEEYKRVREVKWVVQNIQENILEKNGGSKFTLPTVYQTKVSLADVVEIIHKYKKPKKKFLRDFHYVFIIDEINRGNVSKIFGELITLIEESRRLGEIEATEVVLPYSKVEFGVPSNLYLIGTMNTADRSTTRIDTALRRRFFFEEVLPKDTLFENVFVEGVNIQQMFQKINRRIEWLYDREHVLGHTYFLPLKEHATLEVLSDIFKNHVLPLLQEYFYDDYAKIRLILGDSNKENSKEQFILEKVWDEDILLAEDHDFEKKCYEVNPEAFYNIEAYRKI